MHKVVKESHNLAVSALQTTLWQLFLFGLTFTAVEEICKISGDFRLKQQPIASADFGAHVKATTI